MGLGWFILLVVCGLVFATFAIRAAASKLPEPLPVILYVVTYGGAAIWCLERAGVFR